jgi:hypothetical protein
MGIGMAAVSSFVMEVSTNAAVTAATVGQPAGRGILRVSRHGTRYRHRRPGSAADQSICSEGYLMRKGPRAFRVGGSFIVKCQDGVPHDLGPEKPGVEWASGFISSSADWEFAAI